MADEQNKIQSFTKGMNKDIASYLLGPEAYVHSKNMTINSILGDTGVLVSEPANFLCVTLPYTMIGSIPLDGGLWIVFTTDNTNSEIGTVDIDNCIYTTFSNTSCLNFNTSSLITGAARRNFDCGFNVYWSDGGRNPDRYINTNLTDVNNNIWIQNCVTTGVCTTCTNTSTLNCDNIRITPLMTIPCITLEKSNTAGTLLNGTYQVALAYAVNSIKCTNYVVLSKPISIFSHENEAGSITLNLTGADNIHFKEMLVTIISFSNGQLVARKLGIWDTDQTSITISSIDQTLPYEDLANIPLQISEIESCDSIWSVNTYLLRNGIRERPDFNYQPLANNIQANWILVQKDAKYYHTAGDQNGMEVGYLRDEVYCFFIRWVYNTGDKSASYHIPGRAYNTTTDAGWQVINTASISTIGGGSLATGQMAYWESADIYPDNQSAVYGALCGQPIRHHKFPDQTVSPLLTHFNAANPGNQTINILGVQFTNIQSPIDINGQPITTIVGYEILRGSREGNKSIIAKGMINNMREASSDIPNTTNVLYQNYPYNDLNPDRYLTTSHLIGTVGGNIDGWQGNTQDVYRNDIFSFHSPDTTFSRPFIGTTNLKVYQTLLGTSQGYFESVYKHPKLKLLTKLDSALAIAIGVLSVTSSLINAISGGATNLSFPGTPNLPITIPLGVDAYAEGSGGTLGDITYGLMVIANSVIVGAMSIFQLKVVQQQVLNVIHGIIPNHQYAYQYNSKGFYNDFNTITGPPNNLQVPVIDYQYVRGHVQSFAGLDLNNLYRNDYVALQLNSPGISPALIPGYQHEFSRWTLGQLPTGSPLGPYVGDATGSLAPGTTNLCSYYAGLKANFSSQYGQLGSVREIPITSCIYLTTPDLVSRYKSPTLFGGDIYINRYTEKNPFLFFNDWLINVPDDFNYDYTTYENVPYPRYWVNSTNVYYDFWDQAQTLYHLDESGSPTGFYVDNGFFYLFCNGMRDFFVESDVNVGYRDWEEDVSKRFYDPYGYQNIEYMFRSDLIKSDVFYKYDYSLSVNKFYSQYISFGQVLDREYDPTLAYTCYDYFPRRVAYSLPQSEELKLDNWRQFLPNNFYDFYTPVTAIKPTSKTGALFMMKEQSPVEFTGVQILQQGEPGKVAITVGDGGLFNQPLQNVTNAEKGINYGGCDARMSVINTPNGTVFVSQKAGHIFIHTGDAANKYHNQGQLTNLGEAGLHFWFEQNLPSQLLKQFPDYPYGDNPVIGVGVQTFYDEAYDMLYVAKKDYKVKDQYLNNIFLVNGGFSYANPNTKTSIPITLSNTLYFDSASWTASYSFKNHCWVSFHDYFPSYSMSTRKHPITTTTNTNSLWIHNLRSDLFCNMYNQNVIPEIAYNINSLPQITTLKNIEFFAESFMYGTNGIDRINIYDSAWDTMMIYNSDQNSGLLNLVPNIGNPYNNLKYPLIGAGTVEVLYSLKEHIYRINMLFDLTKNRGEFTGSPAQMFNTPANAVDVVLNSNYFDYTKSVLELKKFRNYNNTIFFRKIQPCGANQLQIRINYNESQQSSR